jgi:hypothetical protein
MTTVDVCSAEIAKKFAIFALFITPYGTSNEAQLMTDGQTIDHKGRISCSDGMFALFSSCKSRIYNYANMAFEILPLT